MLGRLDCVLAPTRGKVLRRQAELRGRGPDDLDPQLRRASGAAFYNTSRFDFDNTIGKLDEAGLLFQVLKRLRTVGLHPEEVDNPTMGTIFMA